VEREILCVSSWYLALFAFPFEPRAQGCFLTSFALAGACFFGTFAGMDLHRSGAQILPKK